MNLNNTRATGTAALSAGKGDLAGLARHPRWSCAALY
jgi:hypothetical protein